MNIISIRNQPEYTRKAIEYIQSKWGNEKTYLLYEDCIQSSLTSFSSLPQWYLAIENSRIIGCVGLIPNDFISRMDLCPWLCALFVEASERNRGIGKALIEYVVNDAKRLGYNDLYLCTDHNGYYEKYGFTYLADGYHPWGEKSRIYKLNSQKVIKSY